MSKSKSKAVIKITYTKETEQRALELFDSGTNIKEMAKILALTKSTARLLIIRNNRIPISKAIQSQRIKDNPFIQNTDISNYWLGWLASDGNITDNSLNFYSGVDLEHLKKIFVLLGKELKIYKNKSCYAIGFSNKEIAEYVIKLGIIPKKSKILKMNMPLNWAFVRGVFDGDGSISANLPKITSASIDFIKQLAEFFDFYKIEYTIRIKDKTKPDCYDITIRGDGRWLFYYYLYYNSDIYLERKKDKYRAALEQFKVKNIGLIAGILPFLQEEISSQA